MGLGLALSESLDYADGQPTNGDWGGYLIPTLADAPLVNCEFPDLLEPGIPQGFNGIAEIPHVQAPAAVLSALRAATGHELPRAPGDSGSDRAGGEGRAHAAWRCGNAGAHWDR